MNEPDPHLLNIQNLSISFQDDKGWTKAVDNVSFTLDKGQTLGIVGESGSGKSVTSLSILRLLPDAMSRVDSGKIIFNDNGTSKDILELSKQGIRKIRGNQISMIFQEPMTSLNPVMRCGKQLTESIMLHMGYDFKEARSYTLKLFEDVLLPDPVFAFNAYPHQLSGGQKQRVMIAMAISCKPQVLIADEPTTALDVTVQKSILRLLKELQERLDLSLIFISHDLGVISEIADKVIVMSKGRIVEQGDVTTIFNQPQEPYTKGLLACRPSMKVRLKRLPTVADFINNITDQRIKAESIEERQTRLKTLYESKPLLRVENLSIHYPLKKSWLKKKREYFKAVDDVTFDVYRGETLGLVGESGCGKTTLGRAILRLVEPDMGKIWFDDKEVRGLTNNELRNTRKRMQIIFQDPYSSLNPRLTIGQSIIEPLVAHKLLNTYSDRKNKVMELLEKVGMQTEHFSRYPHQFSGGQRQRVCIARALVLNPAFIICDESVSALDVSVQAQVLNLLNDLKKEYGFTYIFISHDLSVVRYMSDRMLVMKSGKIVERGDSDQLYMAPQEEYTRQLIGAIPGQDLNLPIFP